ncbi:MAG: HDIG domain-containing protein [Bacteroidia bacterium]
MNLRKIFISVSNKHDLYYRIVLVTISILTITSFLPRQIRFKYDYKMGQPWTHEDLRAPFDFPVYKSQSELDEERKEIQAKSPLVYRRDQGLAEKSIRFFQNGLGKDLHNYGSEGEVLIRKIYSRGVFDASKRPAPEPGKDVYIIENGLWHHSERSMHFSQEQVTGFIQGELAGLVTKDKDALERHLIASIQPDLIFESGLTREYLKEQVGQQSPLKGEVTEGTVIIRRGQVVSSVEYKQLESLRRAFRGEDAMENALPWLYIGYLLLVMVAVSVLLTFLWLLRKDILLDSRKITLLFLMIVVTAATFTVLLASNRVNMLMVPLCILPLVTRAFFDTRTALFTHVLTMLILGTVAPGGFDFVYMQVIAGMVAIFSIVNMRKRSQLFIAVSLIFIAYLVSFVGLSLLNEGDFTKINSAHIVWLVVNCLLTLLSYPLIFFIEKTFRVTSDFTLMELTDFNSELLRELALKAPGTFQHSLQVANLAESAIYKIGGNSLLVRVGALYHDIGKMDIPMYFIENQSTQVNPHDELSFDESASIIISHVIRGIEKAKKYKLPDMVIDFIRTHHGTMMVQYFYNSFVKSFPDQIPNEDDFRYPGPRPFSKETAVLMMADSVEAAARSLPVHDQDSLDRLVEKIINHQIESGQFENCDITYREIASIKKIFKKMLTSIYHVRVAYPTFN